MNEFFKALKETRPIQEKDYFRLVEEGYGTFIKYAALSGDVFAFDISWKACKPHKFFHGAIADTSRGKARGLS